MQANADGKGMFAHSGIVGSATAILKDLEERGLLKVHAAPLHSLLLLLLLLL